MSARESTFLAGGQIADVAAGTLRRADVALTGDTISAVIDGGGRPEGRVIDVTDRVIVPGYIEPHTHFSIVNPAEFAGVLLCRGTTTAVVDTLPLMLITRPDRLPDLLGRLAALPLRIRHLIRLDPQSSPDDSDERFGLDALRRLWRLPSVAGVGEVTKWIDVVRGDPELLAKIRAARQDGRRVEGHAPGASYERLVALAEAGFTSCHEAITAQEVRDRLRAGLVAMLRHSPIRPDLPELLTAVKDRPDWLDVVMLTVDGPTPLFVAEHGYLDHLMRIALDEGIPPMRVLRMVTLNPARYFGFADTGEIKTGRRADLNVLADLTQPTPLLTIAGGRLMVERGRLAEAMPRLDLSGDLEETRLPSLPGDLLVDPAVLTPGMRLVTDVITEIVPPDEIAPADLQVALVDQHARWITRSRLAGFAGRLGGLATTFCSSFGDATVVGSNPDDMAAALARLAEDGGGVVVVEDGRELLRLPFEHRLYSTRSWNEIVDANRRFDALMRARGYRFSDPLFSLLFMSFESLPWIRLTGRGIWDVRSRSVLVPAVRL